MTGRSIYMDTFQRLQNKERLVATADELIRTRGAFNQLRKKGGVYEFLNEFRMASKTDKETGLVEYWFAKRVKRRMKKKSTKAKPAVVETQALQSAAQEVVSAAPAFVKPKKAYKPSGRPRGRPRKKVSVWSSISSKIQRTVSFLADQTPAFTLGALTGIELATGGPFSTALSNIFR